MLVTSPQNSGPRRASVVMAKRSPSFRCHGKFMCSEPRDTELKTALRNVLGQTARGPARGGKEAILMRQGTVEFWVESRNSRRSRNPVAILLSFGFYLSVYTPERPANGIYVKRQ
jgi:hypothetical protein